MTLKYLLDENVDPSYKIQLIRRNRDLWIWVVGEPNVPPRGTLDPEILLWCEEYNFVLLQTHLDIGNTHSNFALALKQFA